MKKLFLIFLVFYTTICYSQNYVGGHEYVDLGLPSGDCWATCYVGASTPEEYGGLYAWGETETKDVYTDETYLYTPIYIEGKDSIDPEGYTHHTDGYYVYSGLGNDIAGTQYDVANVKWGHGWKIPTCEQAKELILNCTFEYVEKNGVKGFKVTGPNKKSIFFTVGPNGYGENIQSGDVNSFSCWTSTFNPNEKMWGRDWKGSAYHFWANYINDKNYNSTYYPSAGFTIRPVITKEAIEEYKMNTFTITYIVDEVFYKSFEIKAGEAITPEPAPTKEGYTFSGWSEIPETMPAHDVTVTGTFSINKYKLIYTVDGTEYKTYGVEYGATITPEAEPTKEGYTFSGWSEIPETMPAHDVTVTGTFSINKYKLTYTVDGEEYKTYEIEYGAAITPEAVPTKEGHTFSGWSEIPSTMPPYDVTVTGSFNINSYKLTYMIDDKVYKETMYEYGATITPEPQPEGDYATFEWIDLPQTMPAHDVIVYASYTSGIIEVLMTTQRNIRIYSPNGKKLDKLQKGLNIVVLDDGTVKKVVVK